MEEEDHHQEELQLLPSPQYPTTTTSPPDSTIKLQSNMTTNLNPFEGPSLDLQLSISFRTIRAKPAKDHNINNNVVSSSNINIDTMQTGGSTRPSTGCTVEVLKWQAAEQIRLAAVEKAYAERVRELSRREMELAQTEFARARSMWERAREEVEKAEKLKERATRAMDATCMEITCNSCRQKFRP